jgi:hypothetical protein
MVGAWEATTILTTDMVFQDSPIQVSSTAGFTSGDLVVVTNGSSAHVFQLTGVNSGTGVLDHATSSPWNPSGAFANWPSGGYADSVTQVYKIAVLTYRVDSTLTRRPSLVRQQMGMAPSVVLYDVDRFNVWYSLIGSPGTLSRSPGGILNIDKVQPRIHTRVAVRGGVTLADSVWSEIQPRTL